MAKDRVSNVSLVASGDWRPSKHASRVDNAGVADVSEDARIWDVLDYWQKVFDLARVDVHERGVRIENAGGQEVPNPSTKVMKEASAEIRALYAILGVGPLNRARLGVSTGGGDDADDDDIGYRG